MSRLAVSLITALLLAGSASVHARAPAEEPAGFTLFGLELTPKDDFPNGNATYLEANADAQGQRYSLTGTELDQPILVSVLTRNASDKVRVRIVKDDWDAPDRDVSTAGGKRLDMGFRTFDGFKLWVTADKPTDYQLIVWVGDAMEIALPPIAQPASTFVQKPGVAVAEEPASETSKSGLSLSYLELALGGALLLMIAGLLMFLLMRRKPASGGSP